MQDNHHNSGNLGRDVFSKVVRKLLHTPIGIGLLGISSLFYPKKAAGWLEISPITLSLPRLDHQFDGLRLVQISDIHIGTWISRQQLAEAVDLTNDQQPDIVALTGDFVTFEPHRFADDLVKELSRLSPRLASLAILGNHDHWTDARLIRKILARSGIIDLSNRIYTIERDNALLHIAGIDDYMNQKDRLDLVLAKLPDQGAAILLAHEPDYADISAKTGRFDLQLSGHAHGGQVNLPFIGPPFLPGFGRKYFSGLYQVNGMQQYTTRGIGTAELQVRINCRPEISVISLTTVK